VNKAEQLVTRDFGDQFYFLSVVSGHHDRMLQMSHPAAELLSSLCLEVEHRRELLLWWCVCCSYITEREREREREVNNKLVEICMFIHTRFLDGEAETVAYGVQFHGGMKQGELLANGPFQAAAECAQASIQHHIE